MIKHSKGWEEGILFSVSHGRLSFPYSLLFSLLMYAPQSLVKVLDAFARANWKQLWLNNGRFPFFGLSEKICCGLIFTFLTLCPGQVSLTAVSIKCTVWQYPRPYWRLSHFQVHFEAFSALVSVFIGGSSSSDILKSTDLTYVEGHTRKHTPAAAGQ